MFCHAWVRKKHKINRVHLAVESILHFTVRPCCFIYKFVQFSKWSCLSSSIVRSAPSVVINDEEADDTFSRVIPANMELSKIRNYRENGQDFYNFKGRLIIANEGFRILALFIVEISGFQFFLQFFSHFRKLTVIYSRSTTLSHQSPQGEQMQLLIISIEASQK